MKTKIIVTAVLALMTAMQYSHAQTKRTGSVRQMTWNEGNSQINVDFEGQRYEIKSTSGKINELMIDGKLIPESDYGKYDVALKKIMKQVEEDRKQAEIDRAAAEKDRIQADKDRIQADKDRAAAERDRVQADRDRESAEKDRKSAEKDRLQADKDRIDIEKNRVQGDRDREAAQKDRLQAERDREAAEEDRLQADKDRMNAEKDRMNAEKDRQQADKDRLQAEKDRAAAEIDRKNAEEDRKLIDKLLNELMSTNLITDRKELTSMILDATQFSINGVKQSDALHEQFKKKYLGTGRNKISFRSTETFRGISIE